MVDVCVGGGYCVCLCACVWGEVCLYVCGCEWVGGYITSISMYFSVHYL